MSYQLRNMGMSFDFVQKAYKECKLSPKKQLELIRQYKNAKREGKYDIRCQLLSALWKFAIKKAGPYRGIIEDASLIQASYEGLIMSFDKFNGNRDCAVTTCAGFWIKASIIRTIFREKYRIRIPENTFIRFRDEINRLEEEGCQISLASIETIAQRIYGKKWNRNQLRRLQVYLHNTNATEEACTYYNSDIFTDGGIEEATTAIDIQEVLDTCLNLRERDIVIRLFGLGGKPQQTLDEIGKLHGNRTGERIRQILKDEIYPKLRVPLKEYRENRVQRVRKKRPKKKE